MILNLYKVESDWIADVYGTGGTDAVFASVRTAHEMARDCAKIGHDATVLRFKTPNLSPRKLAEALYNHEGFIVWDSQVEIAFYPAILTSEY